MRHLLPHKRMQRKLYFNLLKQNSMKTTALFISLCLLFLAFVYTNPQLVAFFILITLLLLSVTTKQTTKQ